MNTPEIPAKTKLKEIERELDMRLRLYPVWVLQGKMTQQKADKQIAVMQAIKKDYEEKAKEEDKQMSFL